MTRMEEKTRAVAGEDKPAVAIKLQEMKSWQFLFTV